MTTDYLFFKADTFLCFMFVNLYVWVQHMYTLQVLTDYIACQREQLNVRILS